MPNFRTAAALGVSALLLLPVACDLEDLGDQPDASVSPPFDGGGLAGPDAGPDAGPGPAAMRVTTWNLRNFFDEVDDPAKDDTVNGTIPSTRDITTKIGHIVAVLKPLKPDVIVLQEVENLGMLDRLMDAYDPASFPQGAQHRVLVEAYDPRGIDIGVASRFPIIRTASHLGEKFPGPSGTLYYYARDCLEVHLDVGGHEVVVLANHFISQLQSTSDDRRAAEAQHTRDIANLLKGENPNRPVLIAGDLNDVPTSVPLQKLTAGGAYLDVGQDVATADRYTIIYNSVKYRYDFLLADPQLAQGRTAVGIVHNLDQTSVSDHAPVSATFTVR